MAGIFFSVIFLLPQISYAATLFLSPSLANYNSGDQISVSVRVNTEGESVNATDGTIGFDPGMLEVSNVAKGSAVNLWVQEPSYSNKTGTVNFGGVILNPGYSGPNGNIITIVFKTKRDGQADVNFKAGSVLANDGYGTNVLKAMNGASFNVGTGKIQQQSQPSPKIVETPDISSNFEIFSSTHPVQDKWYSNNDPVFQFKLPSAAKELNLVLSRNEKSTPQIKYAPLISEKILEDVEDGIWYLHANYRSRSGLSQTIKYKFQVDTGLPENLEIVRVDSNDTTNLTPKFKLHADDSLSGIDHYEAKIDNGEWSVLSASDSDSYSLPTQTPGKKQLTIRAYDQAGNYIESSQELQIDIVPQLLLELEPWWGLNLEPIFQVLSKGFDAVINFIAIHWALLIILMTVGALVGQFVMKSIPRFVTEIRKIRYIASEYRSSKKLKKLDSKTKLELKILEKDIKKELELLSKIADHRSLHPDEQYLRNKLEKYYNILKKL